MLTKNWIASPSARNDGGMARDDGGTIRNEGGTIRNEGDTVRNENTRFVMKVIQCAMTVITTFIMQLDVINNNLYFSYPEFGLIINNL